MATNKFLVFDENGSEMMSDADYQAASQRINGVVPGLAEPTMHNKLYRQTSIMAAAIGRVLAQYNLDALDNDVAALAANIKSLFCFNVLDAYPVGAIYISASAVSPAQLFGGTWEQVNGRFLLAASTAYPAGATGGEEKVTLKTAEMPSHSHNISITESGKHSHSGTSSSVGGHTHTRGTMNITGSFGADDRMGDYYEGAFYIGGAADVGSEGKGGGYYFKFEAARTWSGETSAAGAHTHTITANEAGGHTHTATAQNAGAGTAHNNMPPYLSVYVWKRTA